MSILVKPYKISVWKDGFNSNGMLEETMLGIIGSNTMDTQCRAFDPNLVRNVNGTKKFSFKMYSQYIDNITGEKVYNPYIDWLISERKVKLEYDGKWYDFIIKNISENSATHLYTYQLEDVLVQELSKNGFGITLDNSLRNNMGTANELAARVLDETDWTIADDSEVIVQTVDEALVYIKLPSNIANLKIKHILDQTDTTRGVKCEDAFLEGEETVLAFYSSCINRPHRFQFIYFDEGYGKNSDGSYKINRKEDRVIDEKDCQYYVDFDDPENDYSTVTQEQNGLKLDLPTGWAFAIPAQKDGDANDKDSQLSSWYRGKRYGFAQQSEYIPVLDRYCNKYYVLDTQEDWDWETTELPHTIEGDLWKLTVPAKGHGMATNANNFKNNTEYILRFVFKNSDKKMTHMGGHNDSFEQLSLTLDGSIIETQYHNSFPVPTDGQEHTVELTFKKKDSLGPNPYLYIQPNRTQDSGYAFEVEITPTIFEKQEYYGYLDANYDSPALKQNLVSNTLFESTSGWRGTRLEGGQKATVTNVCGRFNGNNFISSLEDLEDGTFQDHIEDYKTYLKMEFPSADSVVINSGPYDHRTLLNNIVEGDKFALFSKYGFPSGAKPTISIGEYKYQSSSDSYSLSTDQIEFADTEITESIATDDGNKVYNIHQASSSVYTPKTFKNSSQIRICFTPPATWNYPTTENEENPYVCYLEEIELFRAVYNGDTLITLDNQGSDLKDRVIDKTYHYYSASTIDSTTDKEELKPDYTSKTLTYETYKPVYNSGAEKVRSITAKESNYFNILQSIAETFEAWLELEVERNDEDNPGKITGKKVRFKNYIGSDNYAGFRYGVNLKDIQRTYESKNLVTKLIVKQNSNELAEDGFCTIARAGANPTGENYIYDFQYFFNRGLLEANDFFDTVYVPGSAGDENSLQGYYPKLQNLNKQIQDKNTLLANTARDLVTYKADLETATAELEAATSAIEEIREDFLSACGVRIDDIASECLEEVSLATERWDTKELAKSKNAVYCSSIELENIVLNSLTNDEDGNTHELSFTINEASEENRTVWVYIYPKLTIKENTKEGAVQQNYTISQEYLVECSIEQNSTEGSGKVKITHVDTSRYDLNRLINEYSVYSSKELAYTSEKATEKDNVDQTQAIYDSLKEEIDELLEEKRLLNQLFFSKYSRFIQEGTWVSEEYVDDEKYYYDAQSVLYNSCCPQVAYSINVLELSALPGYELFKFELGDKTYAEDPEFFGSDLREEVTIAEISEMLDDPSKNNIKVQNFKNQFQDLFQKITATVQQTQYSTGAYQKAVALAEANQAAKQAFFTDALSGATARLTAAGQQEVSWGNDGITVKSKDNPNNAIRMVGGAILLSKQGEDGTQKWVTGVTSDGISASLITAGTIQTGEISIMNRDQPTFRWDSYGISAYDSTWYNSQYGDVIGGINTEKFVRFDKHGIYGIDGKKQEGLVTQNWIDTNATFALTWEGLKVSGDEGVVARIGKDDENIISIIKSTDSENCSIFSVSNDGSLNVSGNITGSTITGGTVTGSTITGSIIQSEEVDANSNPKFKLDQNGNIYGSTITGSTIKSADEGKSFTLDEQGGSIGGWTISESGLKDEKNVVSLNSDPNLKYTSVIDGSSQPIAFYAGEKKETRTLSVWCELEKQKPYIKPFNYIYNGVLPDVLKNTTKYEIHYDSFNQSSPALDTASISHKINGNNIELTVKTNYESEEPLMMKIIYVYEKVLENEWCTMILMDGSIYSTAVQLKEGEIGSLIISEKGLSGFSESNVLPTFELTKAGLDILNGRVRVGKFQLATYQDSARIESLGASTYLEFASSVSSSEKKEQFTVEVKQTQFTFPNVYLSLTCSGIEKSVPLYIYISTENNVYTDNPAFISADDSTTYEIAMLYAHHCLISTKRFSDDELSGLSNGTLGKETDEYFEFTPYGSIMVSLKKELTTSVVVEEGTGINVRGHLIPKVETNGDSWDLGSTEQSWNNIYVNKINGIDWDTILTALGNLTN